MQIRRQSRTLNELLTQWAAKIPASGDFASKLKNRLDASRVEIVVHALALSGDRNIGYA